MAAQLKNFLDQTGPLWIKGALVNKVATVMSSTATQHGGAELAILSTQATLQHHGMIIVPLSYAYQGQSGNDVVRGGSPYGMTTTSDADGSRQPSAQELEGAKFQGKRLAEITDQAARLIGFGRNLTGGPCGPPVFAMIGDLPSAFAALVCARRLRG